MTTASRLAAAFLILVAAAHLLRAVIGIPMTVGPVEVPVWASLVAVVVTGGLAVALFREKAA